MDAIYDSCNPEIAPSVGIQEVDGKYIILVDIPSGMQSPYCLKSQGILDFDLTLDSDFRVNLYCRTMEFDQHGVVDPTQGTSQAPQATTQDDTERNGNGTGLESRQDKILFEQAKEKQGHSESGKQSKRTLGNSLEIGVRING